VNLRVELLFSSCLVTDRIAEGVQRFSTHAETAEIAGSRRACRELRAEGFRRRAGKGKISQEWPRPGEGGSKSMSDRSRPVSGGQGDREAKNRGRGLKKRMRFGERPENGK